MPYVYNKFEWDGCPAYGARIGAEATDKSLMDVGSWMSMDNQELIWIQHLKLAAISTD